MNDEYLIAGSAPLAMEDDYASDKPPLRQRLGGLLRGRWLWVVVLSGLLATALGAAGYFSEPLTYRAIGSVLIDPVLDNPLTPGAETLPDFPSFMADQEVTLRTEKVIKNVLDSAVWRDATGSLVNYDASDFSDRLSVGRTGSKDRTIRVMFQSENLAVATAAVEGVMREYRTIFNTRSAAIREVTIGALQSMRNQMDRDAADLERQEMAQLEEGGAKVLDARATAAAEQLASIKAQLKVAFDAKNGGTDNSPRLSRTQIGEMDARISELNKQIEVYDKHVEELTGRGILRGHPMRESAEVKLSALKRDRDSEFATINEGLRPIIMADGTVKPLIVPPDQQDELIAKLNKEREEASRTMAELQDRLRKVRLVAAAKQDLADRRGPIEAELFRVVNLPLDETRLQVFGVTSISEPINASKRLQMAAFGGVLGAGLGFGLILLLATADRRLRHVEDARVGMPQARMLGILPTLPENLSDPEHGSLAAHSVHHIRTLLQVNGMGRNGSANGNGQAEHRGRVYSITSPAAGSGKSSLTMALGLSYAASGARTLLIDADVVGGGLTRRLGAVKHRPLEPMLLQEGLVTDEQVEEARRHAMATGDSVPELLVELGHLGQRDLDRLSRDRDATAVGLLDACGCDRITECVAQTGVPHLYVLPIGDAQPEDAGSLSPAAMRRIIAQARDAFDVVIIDTGPMLGSLEASMVATEVDGVIFIVSRGDHKTLTQRALTMLHDMQASIAGIVFNHASPGDLHRSAHSALSSVHSRRDGTPRRMTPTDPEASARYGPLASAVASYGSIPRAIAPSNADL